VMTARMRTKAVGSRLTIPYSIAPIASKNSVALA
jgi:hypothetical protein